MLVMTTRQAGYPMALLILVVADDGVEHQALRRSNKWAYTSTVRNITATRKTLA